MNGQGAEVAVDRVPVHRQMGVGIDEGLEEEIEAKLVPGELGAHDQFRGDEHDDAEDAERAKHHEPLEAAVGDGGVAAREQEACEPPKPRSGAPGRRLAARRSRLRLKLDLGDANFWHVGVHLQRLPAEDE